MDLVEQFITAPRPIRCLSCQHKNVGQVNEAIVAFNDARAEGRTSHPWTTFCRMLQEKLDYPHDVRTMKRHAETCLGIELY